VDDVEFGRMTVDVRHQVLELPLDSLPIPAR
jgi:hypothetical protein